MVMMCVFLGRHPRVPHHHCHRDLSGVPLRWIRRLHFYNSQWLQRRSQSISRPLSCPVFPLTPRPHIPTSSHWGPTSSPLMVFTHFTSYGYKGIVLKWRTLLCGKAANRERCGEHYVIKPREILEFRLTASRTPVSFTLLLAVNVAL